MGEAKRRKEAEDTNPDHLAMLRNLQSNTPEAIEVARALLQKEIKSPHNYALIHWIDGGFGMMLSSNLSDDGVMRALETMVREYKNLKFIPVHKHNH